jgi:hypothetical protein
MSTKTEPTAAVSPLPTQVKQVFKEHLDKQLTARAQTPVPARAPVPPHKPLIGPVSKLSASPAPSATVKGLQIAATVAQAKATAAQRAQATATATARVRVEHEAERLVDVRKGHNALEATREVRAETQVFAGSPSERRLKALMDNLVRELSSEVPLNGRPSASAHGPEAIGMPAPATPSAAGQPLKPSAAAEAVAMIERIESLVKNNRPALQMSLSSGLARSVEIERVGPKSVALTLVGAGGPPSAEAVGKLRDELAARGLSIAALTVK